MGDYGAGAYHGAFTYYDAGMQEDIRANPRIRADLDRKSVV